jgi:Skp family chaperone for outer membrane proteins
LGGLVAAFVGYKVNASAQKTLVAEFLDRERATRQAELQAKTDEIDRLKAEIVKLTPQRQVVQSNAAVDNHAAATAAAAAAEQDWIDDWMDSADSISSSGTAGKSNKH